ASLARAGAAALSVLTDERFFGGALEHLPLARSRHPLPVLRKDFILEPYQVHQARAFEADAILLIVAALEKSRLMDLYHLARELGLEVLVEVHSEAELSSIEGEPFDLLGINNRDLTTFRTDLETSVRLGALATSGARVVSESGIRERSQIDRLSARGIHAFLVGETLMRAFDPGQALRLLLMPDPEGKA
ncbi:MAG: indole-3-glycerol-phosphate synthase, partial [Bacteroidetes bacterium]|nr:indole-3-glycerol-phosphate synthase [Bacteroidota bacterium]